MFIVITIFKDLFVYQVRLVNFKMQSSLFIQMKEKWKQPSIKFIIQEKRVFTWVIEYIN